MISSIIKGRLGNQLFQIATAHSLSLDIRSQAIFPTTVVGASPTPSEKDNYRTNILRNIKYSDDLGQINQIWREPSFCFTEVPKIDNLLLDGYFQSERYFLHNKQDIKNLFSSTDAINQKVCSRGYDDSCVAIHVRRGDYVNLSHIHTNLAEHSNYYQDAVSMFPDHHKVIFSDDVEWCKKKFGTGCTFVSTGDDVLDFYLMSAIDNKIIANSSYSWWAAWLGEGDESKIVAPDSWFKNSTDTSDLIPKRWTRI